MTAGAAVASLVGGGNYLPALDGPRFLVICLPWTTSQLGISLPLAAASWYLFESPILSRKRGPVPRADRERLAA